MRINARIRRILRAAGAEYDLGAGLCSDSHARDWIS